MILESETLWPKLSVMRVLLTYESNRKWMFVVRLMSSSEYCSLPGIFNWWINYPKLVIMFSTLSSSEPQQRKPPAIFAQGHNQIFKLIIFGDCNASLPLHTCKQSSLNSLGIASILYLNTRGTKNYLPAVSGPCPQAVETGQHRPRGSSCGSR